MTLPLGCGQSGAIDNFMQDLFDCAKASNGFVLEIGCGAGDGSMFAFELALMQHKGVPLHISIDWEDCIIYRPHNPFWHFVKGDSRHLYTLHEVLNIAGARKAGLIFIDTDHNYEQMKAELPLWDQIADDNTLWLFHDTYMFDPRNNEMIRAIEEFASAHGWKYDDWRAYTHGLGRMRKNA